jgi:Bacterial membrane protein YfhO
LTAIHYAHLPDGRRFDPARMALVGVNEQPHRYPPGSSTATIRSLADGAVTIDVTTPGGGFLVLSESFYPGWRVRIDDRIVPARRTYVSLQGVPILPGSHAVVFELVSDSLRLGAAISVLGAIVLVILAGASLPPIRRQRAAA